MNNSDFGVMFWLGPIPIPWYGFLLTMGFIMFALVSYIEWRKKSYSMFDFMNIFLIGSLVCLFGARWWYLIFNPSDIEGLISFFTISSGRSILGSIFFGVIWLKFYIHRFASYIEFRRAFSIIIPNILLAQTIGRWGNFFQQEVYGNIAVNELLFLPEFIRSGMIIEGYYRQPLFLYESILNFLGWIIICAGLKNINYLKPGTHGSSYLIWYGLTRSTMELFRDDKYIMRIGDVPTSFVMSIIFTIFGIALFIYYQFYYEKFNVWYYFNRHEWFTYKNAHLLLIYNYAIKKIDKYEYRLKLKSEKIRYLRKKSNKIDLYYISYINEINKKY